MSFLLVESPEIVSIFRRLLRGRSRVAVCSLFNESLPDSTLSSEYKSALKSFLTQVCTTSASLYVDPSINSRLEELGEPRILIADIAKQNREYCCVFYIFSFSLENSALPIFPSQEGGDFLDHLRVPFDGSDPKLLAENIHNQMPRSEKTKEQNLVPVADEVGEEAAHFSISRYMMWLELGEEISRRSRLFRASISQFPRGVLVPDRERR